MATFNWVSNPVTYASAVTSGGLDAVFNELAGFIAATPSNVDTSALSIWNVVQLGMAPANSATVNNTALFTALQDANASGGGRILIPGQFSAYQVNSSPSLLTYDSTEICGTNPGTQINIATSGDLFANVGQGSASGIAISNLRFKYTGGYTSGFPIHINASAQNTHVFNCYFDGCPAANFNSGVAGGLRNCIIDYGSCATSSVNYVTFGGSQDYLLSTVIRQTGAGSGGVAGNACVNINAAQTWYCAFNHLSDSDYGITFGKGWIECYVFGNRFDSHASAIKFQQANANVVTGAKFVGNITSQTIGNSPLAGTTSNVYVDTNGNGNAVLDDVEFIGHTNHRCQGHGLEIHAGNRVKVIGGRFSNNGLATGTYANICVSGGNFVDIIGADLSGTYLGETAGFSGTTPYGFIFSAGNTTACRVLNCDLSGNATAAVLVSGTPGTGLLYIRGCRGYNDQNTAIVAGTSNLPTTTSSASAHGYYGPSQITFYGATNYTLNGTTYTITAGQIWLDSPWDTIVFTGSVTGTWVGK